MCRFFLRCTWLCCPGATGSSVHHSGPSESPLALMRSTGLKPSRFAAAPGASVGACTALLRAAFTPQCPTRPLCAFPATTSTHARTMLICGQRTKPQSRRQRSAFLPHAHPCRDAACCRRLFSVPLRRLPHFSARSLPSLQWPGWRGGGARVGEGAQRGGERGGAQKLRECRRRRSRPRCALRWRRGECGGELCGSSLH